MSAPVAPAGVEPPAFVPPAEPLLSAAAARSKARAEGRQWREEPGPSTNGPRPSAAEPRHWLPAAIARGLAFFFGLFTLLGVVGVVREGAFDANLWWVAVPFVPRLVSGALLVAVGIAFVAYAVAPCMSVWRRRATLVLFAFFAAATLYNAVEFYRVWRSGAIAPGVPLPLSAVVAVLLGFLIWAALRAPARRGWPAAAVLVVVAGACVMAFPLAQILFFGTTDYRRQADVVVVFGAQVHNNGQPSLSLKDRMDTAIGLYRDGLVHRVFVSGGVGDSGYNEALVMRDMAVKSGVPASRIAVDSNGVNTAATVADTVPFFGGRGWRRILAVSQSYHLPRIKLAYERAGWNVLTVPAPARERTGFMVLREIPAFWVYYVRAVFG